MNKLRSLIAAVDHLEKTSVHLPQDVRQSLEWDLPRIWRAWDGWLTNERRDVVAGAIREIASDLAMQLGFREGQPASNAADELAQQVLLRQLREEIFSAQAVLEKLSQSAPLSAATLAAMTRRRAGAKSSKRAAMKAFLEHAYPEGPPAGIKNDVLIQEFKDATGILVSEKTLRRASIDMGQNTDK